MIFLDKRDETKRTVPAEGEETTMGKGEKIGGEQLARYRSAVMGFAILWIMAYHSRMSFSFLPVFGEAVNRFRANGFGGVDIFLFLSGFGLYGSLSRGGGQLDFYKRRLKRVIPAYLPVLAAWLLLRLPGTPRSSWPRAVLGNLTGTAFWTGASATFNWYMLVLFSFYFIAPLFFRAMRRPRGVWGVLAATVLMAACFFGESVMIAVTRFTVFALGMELGRRTALGWEIGRWMELAAYALGLSGYGLLLILREALEGGLLWNGGFYWYPFILTAPAMTLALCRAFAWLERRAPLVLRLFETAGECSLEIYLIHIVAFDYLQVPSNLLWPAVYAAMLLSGYIYHAALGRVMAWRPRRTRPPRLPAGKEAAGRRTHIELLRILAAFLVLVNHTNSEIFLSNAPSLTWFWSVTYFFVSKPAVPVFLLIMGAVLLEKEDSPRKSAERILRIFVVFLAGSFLYTVYYGHRNGTAFSLRDFLFQLPTARATTAFWYLYLYLGLLCVLPVLQKLAKALSRRQMEYLFLLTLGFCGTVPLLQILFSTPGLSGDFTDGMIGHYLALVLLGYYLEHEAAPSRRAFLFCLGGYGLSLAVQVAGTYLLFRRNPESYAALDNRKLITITLASACLYVCVKYLLERHPLPPSAARAVHRLGRLTFGIYLLGDFMISWTRPVYEALCGHMHVVFAMVLWELLIFAAAALAAAGLRLVPPLRKWL